MQDLHNYLRTRLPLQFEHFEFGSELIASVEGETNRLRGSDSLAQVRQAINYGSVTIPQDTQDKARAILTGKSDAQATDPQPENINFVGDVAAKVWAGMPDFGLASAMKTGLYGAIGISLLIAGLFALIYSTDTGKQVVNSAVKTGAEAAAA